VTKLKRKKAYHWGHMAEFLAAGYLMLKGYRIIQRRYKCKLGEVDIIASKGDMLAFVEVKARRNMVSALESLSFNQRQRIIRAADWYMASGQKRGNVNKDFQCRFDLVALVPWRWPAHMKNAWQAEREFR